MAVIFRTAAYVIDEDFKIRSFNDAAKGAFPNVEEGKYCYNCIRGYKAPCPDCPLVTKQTDATVIVSDPARNDKQYLSFSNAKLADGSDGYMVTSRPADVKYEEMDAECSLMKHKMDVYRRANYYCAYAYFECNLTRDMLTTDIMEVVDGKEYALNLENRGFKKPMSFSDYNKWRLDRAVLSNRDEYKQKSDREYLIQKFHEGETDQAIMFRSRSSSNYLTWHQQAFYTYKSDFNDDILALCVLRDLNFKVEGDAKNKRNEEIMRILANEYSTVIYVDLDTELVSFVSLPSLADKEIKAAAEKTKYPDLWKLYLSKRVRNSDADYLVNFSDKEFVKSLLSSRNSYSYIYRMGDEENYDYYELKIVNATEGEPRYVVVGIADKNETIKTQQEQQRKLETALTLAHRDSLTGIRNRTSYGIIEGQFNKEIKSGARKNFALIMFDANGLKNTNDLYGHERGNQLLINVSKLICDSFKHSMVYRIGGDEFVAILVGSDYEMRSALLEKFRGKILDNVKKGEPVYENVSVASGMAVYDPENDKCLEDVFKRADAEMYENKKMIKSL
ncbi:MAG: GGDEF domain-containing protein [Clostridia bacterium]|nr:GGDEF domain-containing protein [Clostridia bacterium]